MKEIKRKRSEVLVGATVGGDCARLCFGGDTLVSTAVADPASGGLKHAVYSAANNIAVKGGEAIALQLTAVYPADTEEQQLKETMRELETYCNDLNIQVSGGSTEISEDVSKPIYSVTVTGAIENEAVETKKAGPGDSVVIIGKIGLEGTAILADKHREELMNKFPADMIYRAQDFGKLLSVRKAAAIAMKSGVTAMHDISRGGVFAALWEIAESLGVGLETDLRKIPVMQETIEICNFFDLNPYEMVSGGAIIAVTSNAEELIMNLGKEGIDATTVGILTDSNDRVLINGEARRFLERP
ncbi:MAG: hydrogenase maturation factor [Lachnospiraceae bacterium]|nr:hydrogenase maturation factor [Lachnospiraceae bacterium]